MIILVEGPDGAGKTTLCAEILRKSSATYVHLSKSEDVDKLYKQLIKKLQNYKKVQKDVVIDRALLSNTVYSKVFTGAPVSKSLADKFIQLVDKIIVCLPENKEEYLNEFNKLKNIRHEDYAEMSQVYDEFKSLIKPTYNIYDRFKVKEVSKYVDSIFQSNRK